ncbi:PH domain-containing protein [Skermania sp. ID1734]|uniref:PH domain-containing protein n=1 Tax=Skermania sp. ID1734 TaxID=2597516 RepID=UPI00117D87CA|nr:PH domain-containing protein [Skermania sp. ID1734]TSD99225.1 PH domain-containing protein [Skermania sp. ID1734]
MDNSRVLAAWSTPIQAVVAVAVGGVSLAIAALIVPTEAAGRVLVLLAALGCLGIAAVAGRERPRLAVHPGGMLSVGGLRGRRSWSAADIQRIRVLRYPRLGRRVPMLEIDIQSTSEEHLLVFGRWDLGTNPQDVFDALCTYGLVPAERD